MIKKLTSLRLFLLSNFFPILTFSTEIMCCWNMQVKRWKHINHWLVAFQNKNSTWSVSSNQPLKAYMKKTSDNLADKISKGGFAHTHWVLMWHLTRRGLYNCFMPDYARRCRISPLIMVPINFWQTSDPFKKRKNIFLSQKLTEPFL